MLYSAAVLILQLSIILSLLFVFLILTRGRLTALRSGLIGVFSSLLLSALCHLLLLTTNNLSDAIWIFRIYLLIAPFIMGFYLFIAIWTRFPDNEITKKICTIPLIISFIIGFARSVLANEGNLQITNNHIEMISYPLKTIHVLFYSISGFIALSLFLIAWQKSHGAMRLQNKWLLIGYSFATLIELIQIINIFEIAPIDSHYSYLIIHYVSTIIVTITFIMSDYVFSSLDADDIRYRAIFYSTALPILFISKEDQTCTFNSSFDSFLQTWPKKSLPLETFVKKLKEYFPEDMPSESSMIYFTMNPPEPYGSRGICLIFNPLNKINEYSFIVFDLSIEREKLQQQRDLIMAFAHDVRNPLVALEGAIQLMKEDLKGTSHAVQKELSILQNSSLQLFDDVNSFQLLCENHEPLSFQFDVFNPAEESIRISQMYLVLFNSKNQSFIVTSQLKRCKCNIKVSLSNYSRILTNLLTNAHYHTPPRTKIELGGEIQEDRFVLWVKDWGPGVDPQLVPQLFVRKRLPINKNGKKKNRRFGIGLYSVFLLIRQAKGEIKYKPNPDGGSIFYISFSINSK